MSHSGAPRGEPAALLDAVEEQQHVLLERVDATGQLLERDIHKIESDIRRNDQQSG